ncbi:MAG: serine hydrolase domain-containing protein [Planctomycetota bacterium]
MTGCRNFNGVVVRRKALWIIVSSIAIVTGLLLMATCGFGYYIYTWLQVNPIVVKSDATESERLAEVERWLDGQFERNKFNGGVLLVRDGRVLLSKTCGYTDHTAQQRLDEHSAFRLASVSKQFTAAGVLRLAEMGVLGLDDPVAKHIDGFMDDAVTIRHLLNQASGIPDVYMDLAERYRKELGDVLTISDVIQLVNEHAELECPPGKKKQYSNTNYVLLAGIVESVSGMAFEEFMKKELFDPLEMNDTRIWNLQSTERSTNQAEDFDQIDNVRTSVKPTWLDGVAGDGAVFCSLHDFVKWDRFWDGNPLVSDELLDQAIERPRLSSGAKSDYGFGWVVERNRHWHNGSWLGAGTFIARYPKNRCCLVVLDNSSNHRVDTIAERLEEALEPILFGDETSNGQLR